MRSRDISTPHISAPSFNPKDNYCRPICERTKEVPSLKVFPCFEILIDFVLLTIKGK